MSFYCIHTNVGLGLLVKAEAEGFPLRLTHMAIGDGGGNPVNPFETQTQLIRELYRGGINRVYQDAENPLMFTAELLIPASVGGFTMREVGVFDSNGNLIIVGNLPDSYKPQASEGSFSDAVIRVPFMVSNADYVELKIDPNVVIATQSWIINTINPAMLFPGGTVGQVLRKKSNADGDTEWADPSTANVIVDVIEERQTLAASQVNVILSTVTTRGLAVYIEGVRVPRGTGINAWEASTSDPEKTIVLGKAYPAGTSILLTQNEPAGFVPFPLERSKNLSDVPDKAIGRQNLGVYSQTEIDSMVSQAVPPGAVMAFASTIAPTGWLKANGAAVSRTVYAALFARIGTTFGSGDGFNTFNLPDARGEFIRGWDDGRGIDSGRGFGSRQADEIKSHTHKVLDSQSLGGNMRIFHYGERGGVNNQGYNEVSETGSTETRPRNIALLVCIKF